jgi:phosphate transport system substrate-binding protein
MEKQKVKTVVKLVVSTVLGIGLTVAFLCSLVILLFMPSALLLLLLALIFYVFIIRFLIKWNNPVGKYAYIYLGIALIALAVGLSIIAYHDYYRNTPDLDERDLNISYYQPFEPGTQLAKLDEESSLKFEDNLPILDGATALFPVYASFVNAVYPKGEYKINRSQLLLSKTAEAYNNLLEGKADLIFCAEPSQEQLVLFENKGIKLNLVAIGQDAFVFFVNKNNVVNNLNIEQIKNIYSGKIRTWKNLGGNYSSILAFQRPKNSGSQTILEKIMGDTLIMKPREEEVPDMGGMITEVAVYRNFNNALGYSFLFYSTKMVQNDQIKLLSIDGVYPAIETIQNGAYPFSYNFYAIYIDEGNENIKMFIDWILSGQGQELIAKTGYIPIRGKL